MSIALFPCKMLSTAQIASIVGVKESTVRNWTNNFDHICCEYKQGGKRYYKHQAIQQLKDIKYLTQSCNMHISVVKVLIKKQMHVMRKMKADAAKLKQQEFFESEERNDKPSEIISALLQNGYNEEIDAMDEIETGESIAASETNNNNKAGKAEINNTDDNEAQNLKSSPSAGNKNQADYYCVNINASSKGVQGASEEALSSCKKANRSKQLRAYNVVNGHSTAGEDADKGMGKDMDKDKTKTQSQTQDSDIKNQITDKSSKFFQFTLFDKKDISLKNPNGSEEDEDPVIVAKCEIEDIMDSLEALENLTRSAR